MHMPFQIGFEKAASTAWVRALRAGKLGPGAVKKIVDATGDVRQLSKTPLGRGAEGVAHMVSHPKSPTGVAVQKSYNPDSPFYSRETLRKKVETSKALNGHENMAAFYGKKGGKPVTYHEYVPGEVSSDALDAMIREPNLSDVPNLLRGRIPKINLGAELQTSLSERAGKAGLPNLMDVAGNHGNVRKGLDGKHKVIDFIPQSIYRDKTTGVGQAMLKSQKNFVNAVPSLLAKPFTALGAAIEKRFPRVSNLTGKAMSTADESLNSKLLGVMSPQQDLLEDHARAMSASTDNIMARAHRNAKKSAA